MQCSHKGPLVQESDVSWTFSIDDSFERKPTEISAI